MGEDIKKAWHEKFFSESDLEKFKEIVKKYAPEAIAAYQERWAALIAKAKRNIGLDPASAEAQDLGKRWAGLFNEAYGGHLELKPKIAEAYRSGAVPEERNMIDPEVWEFIRRVREAAGKSGT